MTNLRWLSLSLFFNVLIGVGPRLLIKMPITIFNSSHVATIGKFQKQLSGQIETHFCVICQRDNVGDNFERFNKKHSIKNISIVACPNGSAVDLCNYDLNGLSNGYDIIMIADIDKLPATNFDLIIAEAMQKHFPHYDGLMTFDDGKVGMGWRMVPVMGSVFYREMGYVYNPSYLKTFCDIELVLMARLKNKYKHIEMNLFTQTKSSNKMGRAEKKDHNTFSQRLHNNKILSDALFFHSTCKLSILICSLEERRESFNKIFSKLKQQINDSNLADAVEILYFLDNRERTTGFKRNVLMLSSAGEYTCFVDDDDDVDEKYIKTLYEAIEHHSPDCVSLQGLLMTRHAPPQRFIHSIKYNTYFEKEKIYYRPPNHLNVIKKSIALRFQFPEVSKGEDTDWAMQIARSGLLKKEVEINFPYYFYLKN